jgi:hypothetical protein
MNNQKIHLLYESTTDGGTQPVVLEKKEDVIPFLRRYYTTAEDVIISKEGEDLRFEYETYKVSGRSPFGNNVISKEYYLVTSYIFTFI